MATGSVRTLVSLIRNPAVLTSLSIDTVKQNFASKHNETKNVHFKPEGSIVLVDQVAAMIRSACADHVKTK